MCGADVCSVVTIDVMMLTSVNEGRGVPNVSVAVCEAGRIAVIACVWVIN